MVSLAAGAFAAGGGSRLGAGFGGGDIDGVLVGGNARVFAGVGFGLQAIVGGGRFGERAVRGLAVPIVIVVMLVAVLRRRIATFARLEDVDRIVVLARR